MTRALILIPCLLIGGTEVATLDTAKALQASGRPSDVLVYFNEVDAVMVKTFASANISVHFLSLTRDSGLAGSLQLLCCLWKFLSKGHYDLVWVQYMTPTLVPLLVARLFSRCLVIAVHVAAGHYSPNGRRRLRWLARWWCDRFVCVSQTSARGILGRAHDDACFLKRLWVLPNAINMADVKFSIPRDWRIDLGLAKSTRLIGFVGRLAHNKGVDVLLSAIGQLTIGYPLLHCIIVGDGAERAKLELLVKTLGIAEVVHFVGAIPHESVYAAIKGFDVAVVPSREEGFGLSALEAMACGVPLVGSRVDALQEIVLEGITGILFESESPVDLAVKLAIILHDDELLNRLKISAKMHIQKKYERAIYRSNIVRLFD